MTRKDPPSGQCPLGGDVGAFYIERLNNTLRQRVARRVRKTLWFSKKLEDHIGALWLFIHDYNRGIRERLAKQGDPIFSSSLH